MQQPSYRTQRINELIRRELATLLKKEVKDPRLQAVSITDVLVSKDISHAKIFYTIKQEKKAIVEPLLNKASGFFRTHLSKSVNLRHTPTLKFIYDAAPNTGTKIDKLLSQL